MYEVAEVMAKLNEKGYIIGSSLTSKVVTALSTKPIAGGFLYGKAGAGKSFLPQVLASIVGAEEVFFQCFPGTREDDLLMKLLPSDKNTAGLALHEGAVVRAAELSKEKLVFLILDEWDKTRPSADSFLLDFLQHGRIWFAGKEIIANMDNLVVWITMNDERDLSEPLLRRLPKIDFRPLHPALVKQALEMTHTGHAYLNNAVLLYIRCLMADLAKPATIQELRQLLDAITILGESADWNSLVYQFVTKTVENHKLLKEQEGKEIKFEHLVDEPKDLKLKAESYGGGTTTLAIAEGTFAFMPGLAKIHGVDTVIQCEIDGEDLKNEFGVIRYTATTYDRLVKITPKPHLTANKLLPRGIAEVTKKNTIVIHEPFNLADVREEWFGKLWGLDGEIIIVDKNFGINEVVILRDEGMIVTKFSQSEIVGKANGLDVRWSPDTGLEAIVHLKAEATFNALFCKEPSNLVTWACLRKEWIDLGYRFINTENKEKGPKGVNLCSLSWNTYTKLMIDSFPKGNVPLLKEFIAKENPTVKEEGGWTFYKTPGIIFAFYGEDKDFFGIRITNSFDPSLFKYIKEWTPSGDFALHMEEEIVLTPEFLEKAGFKKDKKGVWGLTDGVASIKYYTEKNTADDIIEDNTLVVKAILKEDWTEEQFTEALNLVMKYAETFFEQYRS